MAASPNEYVIQDDDGYTPNYWAVSRQALVPADARHAHRVIAHPGHLVPGGATHRHGTSLPTSGNGPIP